MVAKIMELCTAVGDSSSAKVTPGRENLEGDAPGRRREVEARLPVARERWRRRSQSPEGG
jgi:hypothetical protein